MPKKTAPVPASETLAYRTYDNNFEILLTVPESHGEDLPYMLPNFFGAVMLTGLKMDDDEEWDWRPITNRTAAKIAGVKLKGSNKVIHAWGSLYWSGRKVFNFAKLLKLLPFKAELLDLSDGKFQLRKIYSMK